MRLSTFNNIIIRFCLFAILICIDTLPIGATKSVQDTISLDEIFISSIKQSSEIQNTSSTTVIKSKELDRLNIVTTKQASEIAPNMFMYDYGSRITSSIYVRGLGTCTDQPVIGMNIDNIPIMDKNNYDFDIADISKIELFRGPQSTLYGRNTMGGVINIYTLSPLSYQGVRITAERSSKNTFKTIISIYDKFSDKFGLSITGQYYSSDGFYTNKYTGYKCDKEKQGDGRIKLQWKPSHNVHIENTLSASILRQSGYPYESVETGVIAYNDTCFYRRNTLNDGLTLKWINSHFTLSSITSYQYHYDNLTLDQDFLPESYFFLSQIRKQHTITQDLILQSNTDKNYKWLVGAFGFYKHLKTSSPITFKDHGIEQLIEKKHNEATPNNPIKWNTREFVLSNNFTTPCYGLALYHQSSYVLNNWTFIAGLRFDYEHTSLSYHNYCNTGYKTINTTDNNNYDTTPVNIDNSGKLNKSFLQVLPKLSITYNLPSLSKSNLSFSIAKGYKAGGFNTQIYSEVLQQRIISIRGLSEPLDIKNSIGYEPEQSWNFEIGTHIETFNEKLSYDASIFYIDCNNQQLTHFPNGNTTNKIMTNAGHARSYGAEIAIRYTPINNLILNANYGYSNAKFVDFNNGKSNLAGKYIPYSPSNTMFIGAAYTININKKWLDGITISADTKGAGKIYWNETNSISQPFYALLNASIRFENKNYSFDLWGKNLTDTDYNTFYFESFGNAFLQRGKPTTFGATLRIKL